MLHQALAKLIKFGKQMQVVFPHGEMMPIQIQTLGMQTLKL